jgi:predicted GNAT family acetyltransferase
MARLVEANPQASRYELREGDTVAGFSEYVRSGNVIAFTHTQIDPAFEGQGLGSVLIRGALDDARTAGLAVLPYCPFVRGYIARHHEYLDLVPASERAALGLPTEPAHQP